MRRVFISLVLAVVSVCCACDKDGSKDSGTSWNFSCQDAIDAYDAFNAGLFEPGRGIYARDTGKSGTVAVGWTQAMMFDMIMNAWKLTGDQKYMDLMKSHYEGFRNAFTFDWYDYSHWDLYDDMMWWVGSLARAYLLTGEDEYLKVSEEGFRRVWDGKPSDFDGTGWSELDAKGSFGGDDNPQYGDGMYWDWKFGRIGKMACINYPTIIAAMELYQGTGNAEYLEKAKKVYKWASENLFNASTGAVADSKHDGNSSPAWTMLVYNQATAMGAAAMLYLETGDQKYLDHACAAMDYVVREKSTANNIIKPEGSVDQANLTDEMGIYNAILAQYIPILINDCGQDQYTEFIERSIETGWKNRDSRGLTNKFLEKRLTATSPVSAYTAAGVPALMLTFPGMKDRK